MSMWISALQKSARPLLGLGIHVDVSFQPLIEKVRTLLLKVAATFGVTLIRRSRSLL